MTEMNLKEPQAARHRTGLVVRLKILGIVPVDLAGTRSSRILMFEPMALVGKEQSVTACSGKDPEI